MWHNSEKERKNVATRLAVRNPRELFMHLRNQRDLAKRVFTLSNENGLARGFSALKHAVSERMSQWYEDSGAALHNIDTHNPVDHLNDAFIQQNPDLYSIELHESNVYHNTVTIAQTDENLDVDGNGQIATHIVKKRPQDMLADDIRNMDVWAPQTITINPVRSMRDQSRIPVWQRAMNTRHVDRDPDGLRRSKKNSSWEAPVMGYGSVMDELYRSSRDREYGFTSM